MPKIQIMSEHLSNKIAAGEVVERPASVVKELVENAIDAHSTMIDVHVEEGGLERIKVMDNGVGMEREDALLAFERHATSKLKEDRDLFHITTLGFRGEALPSIAAVSRLTLHTWDGKQDVGTSVSLDGGNQVEISDAPLRQGTMIEVRDLFYNTPARYKYLKSVHTELSHISDIVHRLALAHPQIAFTLTHNKREIFSTRGKGDALHVIASIYGKAVAKHMIPFHAEHLDFDVQGYLGKPDITRASRSYITLIINGRYIRHYPLQQAVMKAYHTLLPINRYPIVYLDLRTDPSLLDINVHPSKLEARVSKENELVQWLENELRQTLQREELIPQPLGSEGTQRANVREYLEQPSLDLRLNIEKDEQPKQRMSVQEGKHTFPPEAEVRAKHSAAEQTLRDCDSPDRSTSDTGDVVPEKATAFTFSEETAEKVTKENDVSQREDDPEHDSPTEQPVKIPLLSVVGQVHGTYILAQNENGLYMIDQHAAQERVWYEYFYRKLGDPGGESQALLHPLVMDFTASEAAIIKEHLDQLEKMGLFLEEFGHHSYMVRSHPLWFPEGEEETLIRDVVQYLIEQRGELQWIRFRERVAIMMSCKQAIKANHYLTRAEMEALIEQLRTSSNPYTCPHGRPITVFVSKYDIEKMFKRVM